MKMWAGRFKKELDSKVNDFNSSISFDCRMYEQDIKGSMAHAEMLGKCGIIAKEESDKIIAGLSAILLDIQNGTLAFDPNAEDIHMFVEQELTSRIGDAGKRLHTSRSRNDQVALDIRMYLRDECDTVEQLVKQLISVIADLSEKNTQTVMPAYTHLQRAQPITFAHHLLAYGAMFSRDLQRLAQTKERINIMPLGSCAVAATTYPIDRYFVAEKLGFSDITYNSIDGVSDRDFVIELCADLSLIIMHLSRFSEEIILWCSGEFSFIELDDAFSTGSSIMPQKKNPDIAELCRGKCARVYGSLNTLLTMMKGLPLAYNKDMQEDKEAIFDAIDNTKLCISVFSDMLSTVTVKPERMLIAAKGGFINATDCADYLVKQGLPFRDAYKVVGSLVAYCIDNGKTLDELTLDEFKEFSPVFDDGVYRAIDLWECVNQRKVIGGPGEDSVKLQIEKLKEIIK